MFALVIFVLYFSTIDCVMVEIADGKIRGIVKKSLMGQEFFAFMNIPFGKPPVGNLKFQPPQPVEPWGDILDGTKLGKACVQYHGGSEDCLQLNVYTKQSPEMSFSKLDPVIVYFHGGGWEMSSAIDWRPDYLLTQDLVLVTINFRLGLFGFLAVGTENATGNMIFKDQTLALKWVQKNIEKFGGDPGKVTLMGSSAGASSVTAHMVSPMSRGLFHRVIAFSNAITFQKNLKPDILKLSKKIARGVKCKTGDPKAMVECLKKKNPRDIAAVHFDEYPECNKLRYHPVIEPDFGQERFLIEQPADTLKSGNFETVPIMIGLTADEWFKSTPGFLENWKIMKKLNDNFEKFAPSCFSFESGTNKSKIMSEVFRRYYFPFNRIDERSFTGISNIISDGVMAYPVHRFAHLASKFTNVFYYKFSYLGEISEFYYPRDQPYGVHHGDERLHLFPKYDDELKHLDKKIVELMTTIVAQFARAGNPNNKDIDLLKYMNWPKLRTETEFYMDINAHLIEKNGLFTERLAMWDHPENYIIDGDDVLSRLPSSSDSQIDPFIVLLMSVTNFVTLAALIFVIIRNCRRNKTRGAYALLEPNISDSEQVISGSPCPVKRR